MTGLEPTVRVVVDEVLLRGVPPEQADVVVTAFQAHLRHLLETHRPALGTATGTSTPVVQSPVAVRAADAEDLGRMAAASVWRGIVGDAGGER